MRKVTPLYIFLILKNIFIIFVVSPLVNMELCDRFSLQCITHISFSRRMTYFLNRCEIIPAILCIEEIGEELYFYLYTKKLQYNIEYKLRIFTIYQLPTDAYSQQY